MLQCLSNALTRPRSFLLFLQLMSTCELVLTLVVSTESGPVRNSSSSFFSSSSTDMGAAALACKRTHHEWSGVREKRGARPDRAAAPASPHACAVAA
jgi:hypothetical protein